MIFASAFDQELFAYGPPAIFTLDPRGHLRVDPERTREIYILHTDFTAREAGFYVLTDRATGLRLVLVVTHRAMAEMQPRASWERFATYEAAFRAGSGESPPENP